MNNLHFLRNAWRSALIAAAVLSSGCWDETSGWATSDTPSPDPNGGPPVWSCPPATTLATGQLGLYDLTLDAGSVYWSVKTNTMRMPKQGGSAVALGTGPIGGSIVVDDTSVYGVALEGVVRIPKAGGASEVLSPPFWMLPAMVADADFLYVLGQLNGAGGTKVGGVFKIPKAGGEPVKLADVPDMFVLSDLAMDNDYVYWSHLGEYGPNKELLSDGYIMRVAKSGGAPMLVASAAGPQGIDVHGGEVFIADYLGLAILKAPADGSGPPIQLATTDHARKVVADDTRVYFSGSSSYLWSVPRMGGEKTCVAAVLQASFESHTYALALDEVNAYFTSVTMGDIGGGQSGFIGPVLTAPKLEATR